MTETEIDIAIAEKVFGHKVLLDNPAHGIFVEIKDGPFVRTEPLAHYSKNLNDAFLVVKKLTEKGLIFNIETLLDSESKLFGYYMNIYSPNNTGGYLYTGVNENLALIVCKLVLDSIGSYNN